MLKQQKPAHLRAPRIAILAVLILAAALALAACGGGDDSTSGGGETTGGGGGETADTSPIVIASLEGPVADGGPDFTKGMKIAEKKINEEGGIEGRPVEVKIFPKGLSAQQSVQAYRDAAGDDAVLAAWVGGGGGLAIKAQADRVQLPVLAAVGNKEMTDPVNEWSFSVSAGPEYATSGVQWAVENKGTKKIAVLHFETDFSNGLTPGIEEACENLGCEVVDEQVGGIEDSIDQLTPQLTSMKNSGADTYYIESLNPNALNAARQLGMFDKPVISEQWLNVPAIASATGPAGEEVTYGGSKCRNPKEVAQGDETRKWCEQYISEYEEMFPGEEFALYSIYGHDAVSLIAQAAKRVLENGDELTRESLRESLEEFEGEFQTSHGKVTSSASDHDLIGTWHEAYVDWNITFPKGPKGPPEYVLAPGADPTGASSGLPEE